MHLDDNNNLYGNEGVKIGVQAISSHKRTLIKMGKQTGWMFGATIS